MRVIVRVLKCTLKIPKLEAKHVRKRSLTFRYGFVISGYYLRHRIIAITEGRKESGCGLLIHEKENYRVDSQNRLPNGGRLFLVPILSKRLIYGHFTNF